MFESQPKPESSGIDYLSKIEKQISSLEFKEINDKSKADIVVRVKDSDTDESIKNKLMKQIKEQSWWMQSYWKEKGSPTEQIDIEINESSVSIYNFKKETLREGQVKTIKNALEKYQQVLHGRILNSIDYILIDDKQETNPNSGKPQNGRAARKDRAVILYPHAIKGDHRVSEVNNLSGTIAHELGHSVLDKKGIRREWKDRFDWKYLEPEEIEELPGKKPKVFTISEPDRCITDYAAVHPDEDFCESMVAALYNPDILDKERLNFIKDEILTKVDKSSADVNIKDKPEAPNISGPITYAKSESLNFNVK